MNPYILTKEEKEEALRRAYALREKLLETLRRKRNEVEQ